MNKFERLELLIGSDEVADLTNKTVLVLGVGGVGGYVVESLVRSGIGNIILVDYDTVDITNINRQIIAVDSTIGDYKVDVFYNRIKDINNICSVTRIKDKIDESNYLNLFMNKIDFFVDACDTINTKKLVIKECINRNIPFISCMGTGKRLDPSKLEIVDIRKTSNDPIARIIRKFVKDEKINKKVMVCCSSELPKRIESTTIGSCSFVPGSAGLLIGSYVIRYFINK